MVQGKNNSFDFHLLFRHARALRQIRKVKVKVCMLTYRAPNTNFVVQTG